MGIRVLLIEDEDAIATALRETEEEIGLARRHIEVIGNLPDYQTGTGFKVTPVVALVHPPFELAADEFEVAEIFEVPLDFLMDGANHQLRSAEFPNRPGRRKATSTSHGWFVAPSTNSPSLSLATPSSSCSSWPTWWSIQEMAAQ